MCHGRTRTDVSLRPSVRRTPKQFLRSIRRRPHLAVHAHPDSTLEMGATEMGAAIRWPLACGVVPPPTRPASLTG